jgi:hypothetical protein
MKNLSDWIYINIIFKHLLSNFIRYSYLFSFILFSYNNNLFSIISIKPLVLILSSIAFFRPFPYSTISLIKNEVNKTNLHILLLK